MKKYVFPLVVATALSVSCGNREEQVNTEEGIRADGQIKDSYFENNPQVSKEVRTGNLNDGIVTDRTPTGAPADRADLSGTQFNDPKRTNATNNSAMGNTDQPGSHAASNPAIHMADGTHPSVAKGNSINSPIKEKNIVRRVQDELNNRGIRSPRNGYLGEETKIAIKTFQRGQGLEPTGNLTETTLNALGVPVSNDYREPASVVE